jgi:uncharacterized membrane protein
VILQVSPESSALVRGAAATILFLHIAGGCVGLLSGVAALAFRKGSRWHRLAGNVFFVSMLSMSAIDACVSPFLGKRLDAIAGVFTFYLVATAWVTIRRKTGRIGHFETGAFLVAMCMVTANLLFGALAASSPTGRVGGHTATAYHVFAAMVALAAAADLKMILRGGLSDTQRIARHLTRMCIALLIAAASFFLGQQQLFPASLRGSALLFVPEIAVIGLLLFWLLRVRLTSGPTNSAAAGRRVAASQPHQGIRT